MRMLVALNYTQGDQTHRRGIVTDCAEQAAQTPELLWGLWKHTSRCQLIWTPIRP